MNIQFVLFDVRQNAGPASYEISESGSINLKRRKRILGDIEVSKK